MHAAHREAHPFRRRARGGSRQERNTQIPQARDRDGCLVLAAAAVPALGAGVAGGAFLVELGPVREGLELGADLHVAPWIDVEEAPPRRLAALAQVAAVLEVA